MKLQLRHSLPVYLFLLIELHSRYVLFSMFYSVEKWAVVVSAIVGVMMQEIKWQWKLLANIFSLSVSRLIARSA